MRPLRFTLFLFLVLILSECTNNVGPGKQISGLQEPVEIIRDQWGINHIYAQNQRDLFFAQGYAAAKDRLFQFEIWRRQATGTVAEILGQRELNRDIGTRLFMFRGDMKEEMEYYHEDGVEIITAYVEGVNAYIAEAMAEPESLPMEFGMLGITPQPWTPEVVISRHQGLLGNIGQELSIGRAVAKIGADKVKQLSWFHPKEPDLNLDPAINGELLFENILELYNAYRRPVRFQPEDLVDVDAISSVSDEGIIEDEVDNQVDWTAIGSNNWVVADDRTASGFTMMANDPHRTIAAPSLRYMAHLVAPGWNVIGGGEPEIPGISIGHNEYGAWGLTVYRTDGEDLYVYDLNPDNLLQYSYQDNWEEMSTIRETIPVKGADNHTVDLRFTRHGPVAFIDSANFKAYAVRCAWMEPGGSPYLASLRMDQAKTWEEFREACNYSHIPGENMIWADVDGNIGWQSVGIAPLRRNWSGLVPVPGDGSYEWDGYLPIVEKPSVHNPEEGYFATANQNVTSDSYDKWDAIGFSWSDPYRGDRVNEVLAEKDTITMEDMMALQTDYLSIPARKLVPMLLSMSFDDQKAQDALDRLRDWDYKLEANSIAAAVYVAWENDMRSRARQEFVPEEARQYLGIQLKRLIDWIESPLVMFGSEANRDQFLRDSFMAGLAELTEKLGDNMDQWQYGQEAFKHIRILHPMNAALPDNLKEKFNVGTMPRGGNSYTPGSTSSSLNQRSGASFRIIVDTGDWDKAVGTNTPGQSGNPNSPFYRNLFESWAKDEFFPLYYSREKVESVAAERMTLQPNNN